MIKKGLLLIIISIILCGCSLKAEPEVIDTYKNTFEARALQIKNKEETLKYLVDIIHGDETAEFKLKLGDTTKEEITNHYFFNNGAYVQVGETMYRFQFDENGKVKSYILFELEA